MLKPVRLIAVAAIVAASPCVGAVAAWGSARADTQYKPPVSTSVVPTSVVPTSVVPTSVVPTSGVPTSELPNVAGGDVGRGASVPAGALAVTGGDTAELAAKGGALLLAGGGLVVVSRRRRRAH
jgi:LPXTG-motif cell wall-anchored protein